MKEEKNEGAIITVDDLQYEYLNKERFKTPPVWIKRIATNSSKRYYYSIDGEEEVTLYASGTTFIDNAYKEPYDALTEWKIKTSMAGINPNEYAAKRADYGTTLHYLIGRYLQNEVIPMGDVSFRKFVSDRIDTLLHLQYREYVVNNVHELRKDLLAFQQFAIDYNLEPLAIELMLGSKKLLVATAVDLIAYIDVLELTDTGKKYVKGVNKGKPKLEKVPTRKLVIIDFKSGRKGFFEKHQLQLILNEIIVNENYPDLKVDKIYNWSPKAWRKNPGYNFKDQTESRRLRSLLLPIIEIAKIRFLQKKKSDGRATGSIQFKGVSNYEYVVRDYVDIIKEYEALKK